MKTAKIMLISAIGFWAHTVLAAGVKDYQSPFVLQGSVTNVETKEKSEAVLEYTVGQFESVTVVRVKTARFGPYKFSSAVWNEKQSEITLYSNDDYIPGGNATFSHILKLKLEGKKVSGKMKIYRFPGGDGYGRSQFSGIADEVYSVSLELYEKVLKKVR